MTAETTFRVSTPAELIATLPYVIGFHPADSIVVVAVRGQKIVFAARHDLPEPAVPAAVVREEAARMAALVASQGVTGTTVIGYGEAARVTPTVLRVVEALRRAGLPVLDQLRVTAGRYWSYPCTDDDCCPAAGRECLPTDSVIAAEATFAGAVALPDRAALIALIAPDACLAPSGPARQRLAALFAGEAQRVGSERRVRRAGREAVRAAERCYHAGGRLADDEVAWLAALLVHLPVRDYAWERTGDAPSWTALWTDVVRRVEPAYVPAPACLLAFAAWRAGNGALARVAVDRALAQEPAYSMAGLLDEMLRLALHPRLLADWPTAQPGRVDQPQPGRSAVEQPLPGRSAVDQPQPGRSAVEQPQPGRSAVDQRLGRSSRRRRGRAV
jgi:hypothetical protein